MSAPLLAMGSGLLLSTCGIVPASAPAYDLVLTAPCPSIYGNEAIYVNLMLWISFMRKVVANQS